MQKDKNMFREGSYVVRQKLQKEFEDEKVLRDRDAEQNPDLRKFHEPFSRIKYLWLLYPNVNNRCSALISHISIMFVSTNVLFHYHVYSNDCELAMSGLHDGLTGMMVIEMVLYAILLILSLRAVQSHGLNNLEGVLARSADDYENYFMDELAKKFFLIERINFWTRVGVVVFIILFMAVAYSNLA